LNYLQYFSTESGADASFFERLDKKIGQSHEEGDDIDYDDWKVIPKEEGKWRTHDAIIELLMANKFAVWEDFTYTFTAETSILEIPNLFLHIHGYYSNNNPMLFEAMGSDDSIYLVDSATIANDNVWKIGDTIKLIVTPMPNKIINDEDSVVFPPQHYQLLIYEVIQTALADHGKALAADVKQKYSILRNRWAEKKAPITRKVKIRRNKKSVGFSRR